MGFWSTTKEVAGLNMVDLLKGNRVNAEGHEPRSLANESAIATVMANNPNSMEAYRQQYLIGFRRKYRESFSTTRLAHLGFLPESTLRSFLDRTKYKELVVPDFGPEVESIRDIFGGTITDIMQTRSYLQKEFGEKWNNESGILLDSTIMVLTATGQ